MGFYAADAGEVQTGQKFRHPHRGQPAPEHTKDFTIDDWQRLWDDFTDEFDNIELLDKNGKTYSPKNRPQRQQGHGVAASGIKSGIPHLHGAFCRIDERGNINNDHDIHLRAQRAAERVALKQGWTTAAEVRETNIGQVNRDCMETPAIHGKLVMGRVRGQTPEQGI